MTAPTPRLFFTVSLVGFFRYGDTQTTCMEATSVADGAAPDTTSTDTTCAACGGTYTPALNAGEEITCSYECITDGAAGCTALVGGACPVAPAPPRFNVVNQGRYGNHRGKRQAAAGIQCEESDITTAAKTCYCASADPNCNNVPCTAANFDMDTFTTAATEGPGVSPTMTPETSMGPTMSPTNGEVTTTQTEAPPPPPGSTDIPPSVTEVPPPPPETPAPTQAPETPGGTGAAGDLRIGVGGWIKRFAIALPFLLRSIRYQE